MKQIGWAVLALVLLGCGIAFELVTPVFISGILLGLKLKK